VTSGIRALLVDYGGVLTTSPAESFRDWLRHDDIDPARFRELMRQWFAADAAPNVARELETGRIPPDEFERGLAERLVRADGSSPETWAC
jgi:putative hydrolase of the HAD superfamily